MNLLWTLYEIGVNFFQGFIMMYFPFKYLEGKFSDKFLKNYGMFFSVLLAILISTMNQITIFEHFFALLYAVLIFIFSLLCLKGKMLNKIFSSIFPVLIVLVTSAMTSSVSSVLFNKHINDIFIQQNWQRFISVLITQLIIFYLTILSIKIFRNNKESSHQLSKNEWFLISTTLLLSIIIGAFFVLIAFDSISDKARLYIALGIISIVIINIVSFYLIIALGRKNLSMMENEKLRIKVAYNQQYVENADTEFQLIQKLRHDSKAMYQVLGDFLSRGEIEKANNYLRTLTEIADDRIIFVNTDNDIVNSIINAKLTMAKSFGINTTCLSVDNFDGIDDIDLCRLLSNMLDNAITATSNISSSDKKLSISISEEVGIYTFFVSNTINESVLKNNPNLHSTKNKNSYGYGTKIIYDIAKKYNGKCDFYEKDFLFCCSVIINTST